MVFSLQVHVEWNQNRSPYINQAYQKSSQPLEMAIFGDFWSWNYKYTSIFSKLQMVLFSQHMVFMHGCVHVFWIHLGNALILSYLDNLEFRKVRFPIDSNQNLRFRPILMKTPILTLNLPWFQFLFENILFEIQVKILYLYLLIICIDLNQKVY